MQNRKNIQQRSEIKGEVVERFGKVWTRVSENPKSPKDQYSVTFRSSQLAFNGAFSSLIKEANLKYVDCLTIEGDMIGFIFAESIDKNYLTISGNPTQGYYISAEKIFQKLGLAKPENAISTIAERLTDDQGTGFVVNIPAEILKVQDKRENVSVEIMKTNDIEYKTVQRKDINKVPKTLGVYKYFSKEETVYIGRGIIRNRVYGKRNERKNWDYDRIEFAEIASKESIKIVESDLLDLHKSEKGKLPKYNKIKGKKKGAVNDK